MMLSDRDIANRIHRMPRKPGWSISVDPKPPADMIQPASLEVRLGNIIKVEEGDGDIWKPLKWTDVDLDAYSDFNAFPNADLARRGYPLMPGQVILGCTLETVTIPVDLAADITGKSTLGRLFVTTHQTAGFLDPGFAGQVTLEIKNEGPVVQYLRAGMRIGQIRFTQLTSPALRPYGTPGLGSHYQSQIGPTPAAA